MKSCSSPKMMMMIKFVTVGLILTLLINSVTARGGGGGGGHGGGGHGGGSRGSGGGRGGTCLFGGCSNHHKNHTNSAFVDGPKMGLTMTCLLSCAVFMLLQRLG